MADEKQIILTKSEKKHIYVIPAETMIIKEGETNLDMYKILEGNVEIYTGYGTENEKILGILGKGDCFGEFGLLLKKPAIYTAVAYSDLLLCRVTEEDIGTFIQENHTSILQMMRSMANTMMIMQHQINQLSEELDEKDKANRRIVGKNRELLKRYVLNR